MLIRGMSSHKVQTNSDTFGVCCLDKCCQCFVLTKPGINTVKVSDVVSAVLEFGRENRAEPNGVYSD